MGLDVRHEVLKQLPFVGQGRAIKTMPDGTHVWCNMTFNRFEIRLTASAAELEHELSPNDDLVELRWFGLDELNTVKLIPGGQEFFIAAGYIKA